jgi:hypothetical protein
MVVLFGNNQVSQKATFCNMFQSLCIDHMYMVHELPLNHIVIIIIVGTLVSQ